jgi:subtilisin-like proprotein convertase family protein
MNSVSRIFFICLLSLTICSVGIAGSKKQKSSPPQISPPVTPFEFFGDVRNLPAPPQWKPGDPIKEIPRRTSPGHRSQPQEPRPVGLDPLLEKQNKAVMVPDSFTTPTRNFDGGGFSGVNPPDTVGDVGPNHYIQMINGGGGTQVRIYDKQEPVPTLLANFILDSLGSGVCAGGFGDPIVLYDEQADRWVLSEFASSGNNLCVYVSMTNDPVDGGYFNYAFSTPQFPDYPKYSVWPTDANNGQGSYVVVTNEGAPIVYALNRGAMLAGLASTFQRFTDVPVLSGFPFQGILAPADVDGPVAPPNGSAVPIMHHRDTEVHGPPGNPTQDFVEMWELDVDWITPANSTLTNTVDISVQELDSDLCGLVSFSCFPQPGSGVTLDPLREPIMNRLQYINFGSHQTLVGDFVTDVDGTDHGGMRWFELRGGAGNWSLFQEGLYSIDQHHRWIGGIAMDGSGNIALGYSVSSTTVHPDIRYTGRLATDPAGTMSQPETVVVDGTASNASNRWGDYANMNLDPSDNCTFWYTTMYNVSSQWSTRVASMRFDACGFAGSVGLDQETYSCSDTVSIQVTDANLVGAGTQNVTISSTTETTPETVTLNENPPSSGRFTGSIPLTAAPPSNGDGQLSVNNADTINVLYIDADDGQGNTNVPRNDTANVDCQSPAITNVQAVNISGTSATITWNTNEESDSVVVYDTVVPPVANSVSDTDVVTTHNLQLNGLTSCITYFYYVQSTDAAGNVSVDNNGGAFYSFTTTGEASVTYVSTDVPKAILDMQTATSVINIPDNDTIVDVNVQLNANHSWDGDMDITLISPNATQIELSTDNGGNGNNYINTIFDDEATTSIVSGAPPFTGSFRPEGSLSNVDGDSSSGTWTLSIFDDFSGDTGTLNSWSITVTHSEACSGCPTILISPSTLPDGAVNTSYNQSVVASGGTGPYTYAVTSGSLPDGLTLNTTTGAISGTPTTEGSSTFTITATDAEACTGSQSYTINITATPACLFCDNFEDGVIDPNWTYKQTWTEDGDALISTTNRKKAEVIATPIFFGCSICEVQTIMQSAGGASNKVWLLAWRLNKMNVVELLMNEPSDKFVLKQRRNGSIVAKGKAEMTIDPDTAYEVRIDFNGTNFELFVNDTSVLTLPAVGTPNGTVGFRVKNTTARFEEIIVNP